jgi:hypothetical protein
VPAIVRIVRRSRHSKRRQREIDSLIEHRKIEAGDPYER